MDAQALLQPKGDESPSGENLEYDPVFIDMELAAQPGEERQIGDEITAATDPDFSEVRKKAMEVLGRSHDIRAAVYLSEAVLPSQGLVGFAETTALIRGCLEQFWDSCHPELDEDDDNDPTMRINAVQGLSGQSRIYSALRRVPLTDSRGFGRFGLREIEIAEGKVSAPEGMVNVPDSASVSAAFQDTDVETLTATLAAAKSALEDVRAISAVFDDKTPGQGPELDTLIKLLDQIGRTLRDQLGAEAVEATEDESADDGGAEGDAPARTGTGGGNMGGINSPSDVANALDRIIGYYQKNEPSSPIPLLLGRAKRLVNADFMTILKDMAPGGVDNVQTIGGIEDD